MDATRFDSFMKDQIKKIKAVKTEADSSAGHDLGDSFIYNWINEKSEVFREEWERDHS
jgi:hypothetical protein